VTLAVATPGEARRVFKTLADRGTVETPLQETFWTRGFAQRTDRFGAPWIINCA
jgi:PhnB protein